MQNYIIYDNYDFKGIIKALKIKKIKKNLFN